MSSEFAGLAPLPLVKHQPTISYDGVEIPDFGERRLPYGENVDCDLCAALTPFASAARAEPGAAAAAVSGFVPIARR